MTVVIIIAAVLLVYIIASCFLSIREQIRNVANQIMGVRSDLLEVINSIDHTGVQLHDDLIRIEREMPPNGDNGVKE